MKKITHKFLRISIDTCRKICTNLSCKGVSSFLVLCLAFNASFAQKEVRGYSLGTVKEFTSRFAKVDPSSRQNHVLLPVATNNEFAIKIIDNNCKEDYYHIFGSVEGHEQSSFFFDGNEVSVKGKLIFRKTKESYDIYTDDLGDVFVTPIDINKVICIDYNEYKGEEEEESPSITTNAKMMIPQQESFPGAKGLVYLDFDGENVTGGSWGAINAAPSGFNDTKIKIIWTAMSEDYSPFNINITTIRSLYDSHPTLYKMMVIFTPTNTAAPGAGGVAMLNSFGSITPCWVFNNGTKAAFEAGSHETGHTLTLSHDGTSTQGYYGGHGSATTGWGPIMGATYNRPTVQFSKGEYTGANNQEDDLARISGPLNGVGYRTDDHGDTLSTATLLIADAAGVVKTIDNFGIIEKRTDKDVFKFSTSGGNITLTINPKTDPGSTSIADLDIQARLLDSSGTELVKSNATGSVPAGLGASITQNVTAGTYYLEIDGVGSLSPLNTGYSDYGSIGQYFISGNVPPGITGIEVADKTNGINIYPNPNSGSFTINLMLNSTDEGSIEIINSLGQVVTTSSEKISGNYQKEINLSNHSTGIYCVVVKAGNDVWKEKVIIK